MATEGQSYLYLPADIPDHRFLKNIADHAFANCLSSREDYERDGFVHVSIRDGLRNTFVDLALKRARPEHLARYVERILRSNYREIESGHTDRYYLYRVANLQFSRQHFFVSAYRLNLVVPIAYPLRADEIIDGSYGNKKVAI